VRLNTQKHSALLASLLLAGAAGAASPGAAKAPAPALEIRAQLLPKRYTTLAAEISARLFKLHVSEGGRFRAGDALVSFDCALQRAQLEKALAEQSGAETTLATNKRLQELNSIGQAEYALSASALEKARAETQSARAVVSKCAITAPFPGRVAEYKVREQQFVQPGQPLVDILDDTTLELEFLVPIAVADGA
jgi:multidrug resistance efflux pump